ncbi:MAG: trigger factor [Bacteroidaceae bacterium]|nr:trigger factor [Bacteroidaceae bacterium]MBQ5706505.1 trigger factor [Bacteroidaceae bacterium]MBQ5816872.1 trigger factor [Bacteroidaceae bacterium]
MNFTLKNQDATSARLVVSVQEADYSALVEKTLKNIKQKANIPGFRPGMVPMGLIKKQYGTSVKAEEINKLLQTKIFEYIRENNVDMLGEPLPDAEQQSTIDLANGTDFDFEFRIALAPQFDATLTKEDKIAYYKIQPTDEMIEGQIKAYAQRCGEYKQVEAYENGDMLKGTIAEVAEGGIEVKDAVMMPSYMKNDEQKALFDGKKVGDVVTFNPNTAYEGNAAELASLLRVEKEKVAEVTGDFNFTVTEITRFVASELNQNVFDAAFGKDAVKSEEEFRARIKEDIAARFEVESDYKMMLDARTYLMNRVGKMEFNEEILRELMMANRADENATIDDETFQKSLTELSWHLIKEQMVKKAGIKIGEEDILGAAKEATQAQFAQYGMGNVPDELLENYAKEMIKQEKTREMLVNRAIDVKLITVIKEAVTLAEEEVSIEDFNKKVAEND